MTLIQQIAEEFAERQVATTSIEGADLEILKELWRSKAYEVLVFAAPRLGIEEELR